MSRTASGIRARRLGLAAAVASAASAAIAAFVATAAFTSRGSGPVGSARPHRTARALSAAAAAALLALAALQGRAVADVAPAPGTAWQPRGTALPGSTDSGDAPPMRPSVTYRDTIKPGETRFYAVVLGDTASAAVSAFAVPPAGARTAYGDGIELKLQSASGDDCDHAEAHFQVDGDDRPVGTAVSRLVTGNALDPCQTAGQYTLAVHRTSDGTSDPGAWPLELRYVSEPGLAAGAAGPAGTPPPAPATASPTPLTAGTARRVDGGSSFETAASVRTGIWKDSVRPGQTRFYRVPVDWGRQATVFADFSSAAGPSGGSTPYVGSGVRLTVYSPVREMVADSDKAYMGAPVSLDEQLVPVAYANRASDDDKVRPMRYAGWYYMAVTVHPGVAAAVSGALPVTLRVAVTGTAQAPPPYDGDAAAAGIGVDAGTTGGTAGGSSSGGLRFLGFAGLGAGTVLLLALAAWIAAARLRPRAPGQDGRQGQDGRPGTDRPGDDRRGQDLLRQDLLPQELPDRFRPGQPGSPHDSGW